MLERLQNGLFRGRWVHRLVHVVVLIACDWLLVTTEKVCSWSPFGWISGAQFLLLHKVLIWMPMRRLLLDTRDLLLMRLNKVVLELWVRVVSLSELLLVDHLLCLTALSYLSSCIALLWDWLYNSIIKWSQLSIRAINVSKLVIFNKVLAFFFILDLNLIWIIHHYWACALITEGRRWSTDLIRGDVFAIYWSVMVGLVLLSALHLKVFLGDESLLLSMEVFDKGLLHLVSRIGLSGHETIWVVLCVLLGDPGHVEIGGVAGIKEWVRLLWSWDLLRQLMLVMSVTLLLHEFHLCLLLVSSIRWLLIAGSRYVVLSRVETRVVTDVLHLVCPLDLRAI